MSTLTYVWTGPDNGHYSEFSPNSRKEFLHFTFYYRLPHRRKGLKPMNKHCGIIQSVTSPVTSPDDAAACIKTNGVMLYRVPVPC